jgi:hypothetical protein
VDRGFVVEPAGNLEVRQARRIKSVSVAQRLDVLAGDNGHTLAYVQSIVERKSRQGAASIPQAGGSQPCFDLDRIAGVLEDRICPAPIEHRTVVPGAQESELSVGSHFTYGAYGRRLPGS